MRNIKSTIRLLKVILLLLFFSTSNNSDAQIDSLAVPKTRLIAFYSGGGLGLGRYGTPAGVHSTFILSNNWGGSISFKEKVFTARNLPKNYDNSSFIIIGDGIPNDYLDIYSIMILKEFSRKDTKRQRFGIEAGPSFISYSEAHFKYSAKSYSWFDFGSNYDTFYTTENTFGISLRAKAELPLTQAFGIEFAAYTNINRFHSFIGAEIYLTLGSVREKIKP